MPYFSIIIPCFNQANFLIKAVNSIKNQGFQDWEIIIVNDGSKDETAEVGKHLVTSDNRIFVINQSNSGLSAARNIGIKHARGKILNFLDADDWFLSDCLQLVFKRFHENEIDVLVSGFTYFKDLNPIHTHIFQSNKIYFKSFLEGNIAPPVAFFIKNEVIQTTGFFDTSLKSCEDWDYWIRAGNLNFRFFSIPEVLVGYRYVPDSMSRKPKQMYEALLIVSKRACNISIKGSSSTSFNSYSDQAKVFFIQCLGVYIFQGKFEESISWYLQEKERFKWDIKKSDWLALSSNLSFKYFLTSKLIELVLKQTMPLVSDFLFSIGYSKKESRKIISLVFAPQLKKRNQDNFGKFLGGILNQAGVWI